MRLEWDTGSDQEHRIAREAFNRLTKTRVAYSDNGTKTHNFNNADGRLVFKRIPTVKERLLEDDDGDDCDGG